MIPKESAPQRQAGGPQRLVRNHQLSSATKPKPPQAPAAAAGRPRVIMAGIASGIAKSRAGLPADSPRIRVSLPKLGGRA